MFALDPMCRCPLRRHVGSGCPRGVEPSHTCPSRHHPARRRRASSSSVPRRTGEVLVVIDDQQLLPPLATLLRKDVPKTCPQERPRESADRAAVWIRCVQSGAQDSVLIGRNVVTRLTRADGVPPLHRAAAASVGCPVCQTCVVARRLGNASAIRSAQASIVAQSRWSPKRPPKAWKNTRDQNGHWCLWMTPWKTR